MESLREKKAQEPVKPSFLVYLKVIFLTAIILFGMFILNNLAQKQNQDESKNREFSIQKLFSGDEIKKAFDKEVRTNDAYKLAASELNRTTSDVLGEATRIKDQALNQGKEFVADYAYEQTVGLMIENMINRLPERQKEKVLENVCKE